MAWDNLQGGGGNLLIHTGNNEFVDLAKCELIVNLETIDSESSTKIRKLLPHEIRNDARSAILSVAGKWAGSALTPEVLAQRCLVNPFARSVYFNKELFRNRNR